MVIPTEIRQRAIALLEQLPGESLVKAVEFLEVLTSEALELKEAPKPLANEAALLQIIQKRLSSSEQDRLDYLRSLNESGKITEVEHQELLMYIERVEQQDAERAEALIKLSQLRSCELKTLINEYLPSHNNLA